MRTLLDVSLLIALMDQQHVQHLQARTWFVQNAGENWASCPITQNGCIRIMSQPGYANPLRPHAIIERLRRATSHPGHEFWPDVVTLLDAAVADGFRIHGPRQVTDAYLLALAVQHGGRLATFDESIAVSAVRSATDAHLVVISRPPITRRGSG